MQICGRGFRHILHIETLEWEKDKLQKLYLKIVQRTFLTNKSSEL